MARKGMSLTLKVIVIVVVVLIAALTVLSIFAGGIGQAGAIIGQWLGSVQGNDPTGLPACGSVGGICTASSACDGTINTFAIGCASGTVCCVPQNTGPPAPS